ncbi:hypothetical protein ACHAWF_011734 [Thalassiosira exigua]
MLGIQLVCLAALLLKAKAHEFVSSGAMHESTREPLHGHVGDPGVSQNDKVPSGLRGIHDISGATLSDNEPQVASDVTGDCCAACDAVWNSSTGQYSCGDRIKFKHDHDGLSWADACAFISNEFSGSCAACSCSGPPPAPTPSGRGTCSVVFGKDKAMAWENSEDVSTQPSFHDVLRYSDSSAVEQRVSYATDISGVMGRATWALLNELGNRIHFWDLLAPGSTTHFSLSSLSLRGPVGAVLLDQFLYIACFGTSYATTGILVLDLTSLPTLMASKKSGEITLPFKEIHSSSGRPEHFHSVSIVNSNTVVATSIGDPWKSGTTSSNTPPGTSGYQQIFGGGLYIVTGTGGYSMTALGRAGNPRGRGSTGSSLPTMNLSPAGVFPARKLTLLSQAGGSPLVAGIAQIKSQSPYQTPVGLFNFDGGQARQSGNMALIPTSNTYAYREGGADIHIVAPVEGTMSDYLLVSDRPGVIALAKTVVSSSTVIGIEMVKKTDGYGCQGEYEVLCLNNFAPQFMWITD